MNHAPIYINKILANAIMGDGHGHGSRFVEAGFTARGFQSSWTKKTDDFEITVYYDPASRTSATIPTLAEDAKAMGLRGLTERVYFTATISSKSLHPMNAAESHRQIFERELPKDVFDTVLTSTKVL